MRAMVLEQLGRPLELRERAHPTPAATQIRVRVAACAVCRTDLHVVDGELPNPKLPLVPGHEIVGTVDAVGGAVQGFAVGDRVGIPWLGWTCGTCEFCRSGKENLCDAARFTGYTLDGGYAAYAVADARYAIRLPPSQERTSDVSLAPLFCAGLIGYRSYRAAGDAPRLGLYGFGAAAHVIAQVALHEGRTVFAFTRPGDEAGQAFARRLGVQWAGGSNEPPPEPLDAAIIFAPVGALVPTALRHVRKGGTVVCAGIHMTDIPAFPYEILWGERVVRSVANLTRQDAEEFFRLRPGVPVETATQRYALEDANQALHDLRAGRVEGAAVLVP